MQICCNAIVFRMYALLCYLKNSVWGSGPPTSLTSWSFILPLFFGTIKVAAAGIRAPLGPQEGQRITGSGFGAREHEASTGTLDLSLECVDSDACVFVCDYISTCQCSSVCARVAFCFGDLPPPSSLQFPPHQCQELTEVRRELEKVRTHGSPTSTDRVQLTLLKEVKDRLQVPSFVVSCMNCFFHSCRPVN